jgi:hypothetical protein
VTDQPQARLARSLPAISPGADPDLRDSVHYRVALDGCQAEHPYLDGPSHDQAEVVLRPATSP